MDISEFIKETIRQVCDGITMASRECSQSGVIVNPAISVGENGDFFIPAKPSSVAMQRRVQKIDFDIALVGCGAYGMPLAAHCKQMGKQAVHLAGWLQVLFGIKGTRWDNNPRVSKFYNEYWIRPSQQNRPQGVEKVENACYW